MLQLFRKRMLDEAFIHTLDIEAKKKAPVGKSSCQNTCASSNTLVDKIFKAKKMKSQKDPRCWMYPAKKSSKN